MIGLYPVSYLSEYFREGLIKYIFVIPAPSGYLHPLGMNFAGIHKLQIPGCPPTRA